MKIIGDILKKASPNLASLIKKSDKLKNLSFILYTVLDSTIASNCHFANYNNSELTIIVKNSSWKTRVRFAVPEIIKQLRVQPEFKNLAKIKCYIEKSDLSSTRMEHNKSIAKTKISLSNSILLRKTILDIKNKSKI